MKLDEIIEFDSEDYECEIVYIDEDGNEVDILDEGFMRQMKKVGGRIKKQYRCTSGPKKGKIVATPQACAKRKDPKKRRHGRKVARQKKGIRTMKTKIAKKKQISKRLTRLNRRLSGKSSS